MRVFIYLFIYSFIFSPPATLFGHNGGRNQSGDGAGVALARVGLGPALRWLGWIGPSGIALLQI